MPPRGVPFSPSGRGRSVTAGDPGRSDEVKAKPDNRSSNGARKGASRVAKQQTGGYPPTRPAGKMLLRDRSVDCRRPDRGRRARGSQSGTSIPARGAPRPGAGRARSAAPGPRSGIQGRRIERRDRRALLPKACSASKPHLSSDQLEKLGCATSSRTGTTATSRPRRARARRLPAGAVVPARSWPARELRCCRWPRRRRRRARRLRGARDRLGADRARVSFATPGGTRTVADALARRRERSRRPAEAAARAGAARSRTAPTPAGSASPSRVCVDDWSDDPAWQARVPAGQRWLSTNHLMGAGYWVWLIPLGSGSTSSASSPTPTLHPFHRINRFDRAMDWLREFEPQCAAVVEAAAPTRSRTSSRCGTSHTAASRCSRPTGGRSSARPASSPIRSTRQGPTSSRSATTTPPIWSSRDLAGEDATARARRSTPTYLRLFDAFMRLYDGQYRMMGNAQVMTAKVAWDNACYWCVTALLYFQRRFTQPEFMRSIDPLCVDSSCCTRGCSNSCARGTWPTTARSMRPHRPASSTWGGCVRCSPAWPTRRVRRRPARAVDGERGPARESRQGMAGPRQSASRCAAGACT